MKKLYPKSLLSLLFLLSVFTTSYGQCPLLEAGDDKFICSSPPDPVTLDILINGIPELIIPQTGTDSYRIAVPPCPLPPLTGTPIDLSADDMYSDVQNLLFEFSFFGVNYTQFVVGANGKISFDTSLANGPDDWTIAAGELLPIIDGTGFPANTIFGAYHDIDPGVGGDINFFISGTAPERALVVNYNMIPQFSCNDLITNQQIILYESTNMIQVNIFNKPVCDTWNGGLATLGIQGNDVTEFAVPPGRNTGVWSVDTAETWYFIPDGLSNTNSTFTVTDQNTGLVVATAIPATVSPTVDTTYLVEFTFELPNGTTTTISDTVTVFVADPPTFPGPTQPLVKCDPDNDGFTDFTLTDADLDITGGDPDLIVSYHGTMIDADLNQLPLPDPYTNDTAYNDSVWARVESMTTSCYQVVELFLEVRDSPVATVPSEPLRLCDEDGTQDG
ncbi:hypothetical protein POV27_15610, partial [Aureisphaera galaxeae]|nr:hypothetical protein [Aureisphaera galaxeae]